MTCKTLTAFSHSPRGCGKYLILTTSYTRYCSVVHRVVNFTGVERYSFPFNFNGNPEYIIKCLQNCRVNHEDEKYAPVTVENFIRPQYATTYGRIGKYDVAPTAKVQA